MDRMLDYDRGKALDVRIIGTRDQGEYLSSDLTFLAREGTRRAASLLKPAGAGPFPAVLYVHWYEPQACDSNRTQFFEEACDMARTGVMSLLVETMWSDREWFLKRTQEDDLRISVEIVIELRRAMDLLLQQPDIDPSRFAYVGHDFGAMYGVVAGSVDPRPSCYVLMAGTPRFSDWFLYYPSLKGEAREQFMEKMKPLDPIERVGSLVPVPILFQFGKDDPHVPVDRGEAFSNAAISPETHWYDAGHGLNPVARSDRMAWLATKLNVQEG